MQRSTSSRSTLLLATGLCGALALGCSSSSNSPSPGTGGKSATGGSGNPGSGGGNPFGSGGSGNPGSGGSGNPGTGGSDNPGSGGSGNPGSGGNGNPGTGGNGNPGTGGSGNPGTGGGAAGGGIARACPVVPPPGATAADVISDFEDGYAIMINQGSRTGYWTTYNNTADPQNQTPPKPAMADKFPVEPAGACMMSAFHSSATGQDNYVGFGARFKPKAPVGSDLADPYDVTQWDGITFRAKTGGTPAMQPVFVEILTKDTQPATAGGTATASAIDLYNNRGLIANVSSTTYQQFFIPFGAMIPRSLPAPGAGGSACPAAGAGVPKCQAPAFNPMNALGIQFSFYGPMDTPGFPAPNPVGSYNIFVDDIAFYKRSALPAGTSDLPALPSSGGAHPLQASAMINARCTKAAGSNGRLIALAYDNWKKHFVVTDGGGFRINTPDVNGAQTVSEAIAYGMLISVYMDDKALFDGLYTYWKGHGGSSDGALMVWKVPGGTGTATDADEDAAFAMLMASKQWTGGSYAADATKLIKSVLANDMSGSYIKAGSNYSGSQQTNPSYFAPAYYRAFAKADAGDAAAWTGLANGAYTLLSSISGTSSNGLYAAWCGNNCTQITTNPGSMDAATDVLYQYDSHRIPWRIGTDYCWNGTAAAKTYVDKTSAFFSSPSRGGGGVGRILDIYNPNGTDTANAASNSASIVGTAASGAMANTNYAPFVNDAYQMILDLLNRGDINDRAAAAGKKSAYSYYNSTVGLLTLLTMNGSFQDWTQ